MPQSAARYFAPPRRRAMLSLGSLVLLVLAGCAYAPLGTVRESPLIQVPTKWGDSAVTGSEEVEALWWKAFGCHELDALVAQALESNRDLQVLAARLEQAQALAEGAAAERRPQLSATAAVQRGRSSGADPKVERSAVDLRASWEVDVFSRGALALGAAQADAKGTAHALEAARIALAADVSTAYFDLRTLNARAKLGRAVEQLAQRQLAVAQRKFHAGQATSLDVARWEAELAQERAAVAEIEGSLRAGHQQLAILLGASFVPVLRLDANVEDPRSPALTLPAALLERRPDVQRSAGALDAALHRVGIARREIYPRLQIDLSGARERLIAIGGSASPVSVVGYGVSMSLPILDGGRIRANIAVQESRAREAMAEYEKTMLAAFADVEVALARWRASETVLNEWRLARSASELTAGQAERQFEAGAADLSTVLDARRSHLRSQSAVIQAEGARWAAAIALRRVFAGAV